ncbi:helix-turn-helix domain-containing protein [Streptomyces sp. CA-253872]|uniref:helix-turn-helix domain-containing protein n=1 Tax=Streptomyces sp. CA-253872 TaxID=3240067 RepID=UPI003D8E035C
MSETQATPARTRAVRHGTRYRTRLVGEERTARARELLTKYRRGESIRSLAGTYDMAYGTVRRLLLEQGADLQSRGPRGSGARAASDRL